MYGYRYIHDGFVFTITGHVMIAIRPVSLRPHPPWSSVLARPIVASTQLLHAVSRLPGSGPSHDCYVMCILLVVRGIEI